MNKYIIVNLTARVKLEFRNLTNLDSDTPMKKVLKLMAQDKNLVAEIFPIDANEINIRVGNTTKVSPKAVYEYCLQILQQTWIENLEVNSISYHPILFKIMSIPHLNIFPPRNNNLLHLSDDERTLSDIREKIEINDFGLESKKEQFKITYDIKEQKALHVDEIYSNKALSGISTNSSTKQNETESALNLSVEGKSLSVMGVNEPEDILITPQDSASNVKQPKPKLQRSTGFIEIPSLGLILDKSKPNAWDKNSIEMLLTAEINENGLGIDKNLLRGTEICGLHFFIAADAFLESKREIERLLDDINPIVVRRALIAWIYRHLIEKP